MNLLRFFTRITGQRHILPFYHAVSDKPMPHLRNLYAVKKEKEFVADLDFLLKNYEPVSVQDYGKWTKAGIFPEKNTFLLSFDDGLRECIDVIAPILEKKGIPAIFFVNSGFVDNKALFFRYKASLCLETLKKLPPAHASFREIQKLTNDSSLSGHSSLRHFLLSAGHEYEAVIDFIAGLWAVSFEDFLEKEKPYLTTEQISNLLARGFQIGAHSVNHPHYYKIPLSEQLWQTEHSLDFLASLFGLKERYFSFPFTDYKITDGFFRYFYPENPEEKAKMSLSFGCAGLKKEKEKFHFQRIAMEGGKSEGVEWVLYKAYLYYSLKAISGKNTIKR
ncbi:MAG: polysaccharide deacetylase family protein [Bacteroidia bacterium]|nr:polysaccharide deacetylase family protein [Bacteroidia bacterium]